MDYLEFIHKYEHIIMKYLYPVNHAWDRYRRDSDYAAGVDDAMEDIGEDW